MKKTVFAVLPALAAALIVGGVAYAASEYEDVASRLGGVDGDIFDLHGAMKFDTISVGRQGSGGVTFFNGTIVNTTTDSEGNDNPVTFGDNVRIDGNLYNGATDGDGNGIPLKIVDDVRHTGDTTQTGDLSVSGSADVGSLTWDAVTSYLSVPAAAFVPDGHASTYTKDTHLLSLTGGAPDNMFAYVQLPHGATITSMKAVLWDNTGTDMTITLESVKDGETDHETHATVTSSGASGSYREFSTSAITTPTVNNEEYAYAVHALFTANTSALQTLRKVEIGYTTTSPY